MAAIAQLGQTFLGPAAAAAITYFGLVYKLQREATLAEEKKTREEEKKREQFRDRRLKDYEEEFARLRSRIEEVEKERERERQQLDIARTLNQELQREVVQLRAEVHAMSAKLEARNIR